MLADISNLSDTIVPKSDQLNADQLLGGSMTITVTDVRRGQSDDQPVIVHYQGDEGRPYKPCKTMRKVLIFAWGDDGHAWIGRSMTLYNDPDVKFGGVKVGGIRISHMSDIDADLALSLTATRGKRKPFTVKRLAPVAPAVTAAYPVDKFAEDLPKMRDSLATGKSTIERILTYCATIGTLTAEQEAAIRAPITTETDEETY